MKTIGRMWCDKCGGPFDIEAQVRNGNEIFMTGFHIHIFDTLVSLPTMCIDVTCRTELSAIKAMVKELNAYFEEEFKS